MIILPYDLFRETCDTPSCKNIATYFWTTNYNTHCIWAKCDSCRKNFNFKSYTPVSKCGLNQLRHHYTKITEAIKSLEESWDTLKAKVIINEENISKGHLK